MNKGFRNNEHDERLRNDPIFKWLQIIGGVVMAVFGLVVFTNVFVQSISSSEPRLGTVTGQLRAGRTVILRLPTSDGRFDQLTINNAGHTTRGVVPAADVDAFTRTELTPDQFAAIEALREGWCDTRPRFPDVKDTDPFYDIGIHCRALRDIRVKVPLDQLPAALQNVLDTVPLPP